MIDDLGGLGRLAAWCYDHRRRVLLVWVVVLIGIVMFASSVGSAFSDNFASGNSASQRAQSLLTKRFPAQAGDTANIVVHTATPVRTPSNVARIAQMVAAVRPLPQVTSVQSPLAQGASDQISADGHTAFAVVQFDKQTPDLKTSQTKELVRVARGFAGPGFQVALGGDPISATTSVSPGSAEGIGIFAAIIIMLIAFGSVVAMGLPILIALLGVGIGYGLVDFASHGLTIPTFGPELMAMIGLGVGIDYALFIVTRYRQCLLEGRDPREAVAVALATAGRAVLFAGSTVIISLCGLFVVALPFMIGLAVGAIAAVVMLVAASMSLLPAMLGFVGHTIDRLHVPGLLVRSPGAGGGFWYRWSRTVQRRPWVCGTAALTVLVVLAIPLFSMRLAFTDAGNDPTNQTTRQAYDLLARGFGPGFNGPLVLTADLRGAGSVSAAGRAVATLDGQLRSVPGVASVTPARFNPAG
ncbi:MAG: MMPL family transporter, partial [Mycobacterium sp.]|nr:MMPL family transporter [Mycobacterium sp.]